MEKDIYFSKMDKSLSVNFRMEASQEKDNISSTNNVWAKGIGKMASWYKKFKMMNNFNFLTLLL